MSLRACATTCIASCALALLPAGDALGEVLSTVARVQQLDSTAGYAFQNEDYSTALESLMLAHQLMPATPRLFNIAVCHERLGDERRAIEAYQRYADAEDAEEDGRAQALARVAELQAEVAAAEVAAAEAAAAAAATAAEADAGPIDGPSDRGGSTRTALHRQWWFWVGIVGGALLIGGTAAGLAVGLSGQGPGTGDVNVWLP